MAGDEGESFETMNKTGCKYTSDHQLQIFLLARS